MAAAGLRARLCFLQVLEDLLDVLRAGQQGRVCIDVKDRLRWAVVAASSLDDVICTGGARSAQASQQGVSKPCAGQGGTGELEEPGSSILGALGWGWLQVVAETGN